MLQNRKIYENDLQVQLARWKADIDFLEARVKRVGAVAAAQLDKSIVALQRQHAVVSHQLSSLKAATDEAWESVKAHEDRGWTGFKTHSPGSQP